MHASPSSQTSLLLVTVQPEAGRQLSSVQLLPSSHWIDVPAHLPSPQTSFPVQASPSSHSAVLFLVVQPVLASQASSVQTSPSSQVSLVPAHLPPSQASFSVHASPSSQLPSAGSWVHPLSGSHPSLVQGSPSSQFLPPAQAPASGVPPSLAAESGALCPCCRHPASRCPRRDRYRRVLRCPRPSRQHRTALLPVDPRCSQPRWPGPGFRPIRRRSLRFYSPRPPPFNTRLVATAWRPDDAS